MNMDEGWAKPGLKADAVFNDVHEWVTLKARKRRSRMILGDWLDLVDTISRERAHNLREVSDALTSLLDQGWLEKTDHGFRVLVEKNLQEVSATPCVARGERGSLVAKRLGAEDAVHRVSPVEASAASRASERSVQNRGVISTPRSGRVRVELCRDVFPNLVEDHGLETIPRHLYWQALCSQVKKLEIDFNVDPPFIRRMMEEFVRHPQWSQRSRRPAWQVFIGRRQELVKLVHAQRRRNPNRTGWSQEDWLRRSNNGHTVVRDWLARS
jgi:hypothetical protein